MQRKPARSWGSVDDVDDFYLFLAPDESGHLIGGAFVTDGGAMPTVSKSGEVTRCSQP